MDWAFTLHCFLALIAILNPIGAVPVYLSLTGGRDRVTARRVTRNATLTVLTTVVVFAAFGQVVLAFFGITVPAFRVAGGILLLLMSIAMLYGRTSPAKHDPQEEEEAADRESIAIVPLGLPILAGPGSISTSILLAQRADTWPKLIGLALSILLATALVYVTFRLAERMQQVLGRTGIGIANRVMGLILAAVAVQFIADGARQLFPILAQPR